MTVDLTREVAASLFVVLGEDGSLIDRAVGPNRKERAGDHVSSAP